jgi:hypothetical protein
LVKRPKLPRDGPTAVPDAIDAKVLASIARPRLSIKLIKGRSPALRGDSNSLTITDVGVTAPHSPSTKIRIVSRQRNQGDCRDGRVCERPRCRRKSLVWQIRQQFGEVFHKNVGSRRAFAAGRVHINLDPAEMRGCKWLAFTKGKSAIHIARVQRESKRIIVGQSFIGSRFFVRWRVMRR